MTNEISYEDITEALDYAGSPAKVDAVFDTLNALDPAVRENIIDKLVENMKMVFKVEAEVDRITQDELLSIKEEAAELATATDPYDIADYKNALEDLQSCFQVVLNIAKIKGDTASNFIKVHVDELKKLSSEEYNSCYGLLQATYNIQNKLTPADLEPAQIAKLPAKPNPFASLDLGTPKPATPKKKSGPRNCRM